MSVYYFVLVMGCLGVSVHAQMMWPLYPLPYLHPLPLASARFHAQDNFGQFNFGYSADNQFRAESRSLDGSVHGSYSYMDPTNKLVHVTYVADAGGFRVLGGNNLPTVAATPTTPPLPQAVEYTPEVAAARAEFEKTYQELAAQAAAAPESSRRKRSVLFPALYTVAPAPTLKVQVTEGEELKDVISPANTQAVEYKEVEKSVPLLVAPPLTFGPLWLQ